MPACNDPQLYIHVRNNSQTPVQVEVWVNESGGTDWFNALVDVAPGDFNNTDRLGVPPPSFRVTARVDVNRSDFADLEAGRCIVPDVQVFDDFVTVSRIFPP